MANLQELLGMQADKVERPPSLPPGSYMVAIVSHKFVKSSQKQTDGLELTLKVLSAHESVDQDALDKVKDWRGKEITDTIWLTQKSLWRLTGDVSKGQDGVLQNFGVDVSGKQVMECVAELDGKTALAELVVTPNRDNTGTYNEVKGYQKA